MVLVEAFARWINGTWVADFVNGLPWTWPICETLHFLGMALLIGTVGLLDARMLGVFKGLPGGPLARLAPWGVAGFVINLVTGFLFFAAAPGQYIDNSVFWYKMLFIALAGANVLVFYVTDLARRVEALQPGDAAPLGAQLVAGSSLFLWFGVIFWGRMLPFIGNAF
jgi:hypothetical protein